MSAYHAVDEVTKPIDTRRDQAFRLLSRYLPIEGSTVHCLSEPTRTVLNSWVRVFTGGFTEESEQPWVIDLTTACAEVLNLKTERRYNIGTWMFLNSSLHIPSEVALSLTRILNRPKGSIKGRYL